MTLERKSNIVKFVSILLVLDKKHIIKIIKEVKKVASIYDNQIIKGIFKLSVQSDLIIRTFASDTHSNEGFGRDIVTDGTFAHTDYEADVYVVAEFWKIG